MSCFTQVTHSLGNSILPAAWVWTQDHHICPFHGLQGTNGCSCLTSSEKQVEDIPEGNGETAGTAQGCLTGKPTFLVHHTFPQQHSCSPGAKQSLPSPHRALDSRSPSLADCHPRLFHHPQTLEPAGPFQLLWPPAAVGKVFAPPERPPRVQPWEEQLQVGRAWLTGLLHTHRNTLRTTHSNQDPPNPAALINASHLGLPERLSRGTPR